MHGAVWEVGYIGVGETSESANRGFFGICGVVLALERLLKNRVMIDRTCIFIRKFEQSEQYLKMW
jgi:hypothetical protein